jgi:glycerophosphoryl diester phosphodiesterase
MNNKHLIIGHRGVAGYALENTLQSLNYASNLGLKWVEVDIRQSLDQVFYLLHDEDLIKVANDTRKLNTLSESEVATITLTNGETLLRLTDALSFLLSGTSFDLEIKEHQTGKNIALQVKEFINKYQIPDNRIIFSSFIHSELLAVKDVYPKATISPIIYCNPLDPVNLCNSLNATILKVSCETLDKDLAIKVVNSNIKLWVYTVNTVGQYNKVINLGATGIITDYPKLLMKFQM